jgi:hypothetical protein
MQNELAGTGIKLLGVNQIGEEYANAAACFQKDIPWLQDNVDTAAWDKWQVGYRDVYILDANNELIAVYNLTAHDLADASNYDELKLMLETAAAP